MKIAVIGAGAIGCLVAGYLKLKNEDVLLIGHPESVKVIKEKGLIISGVRGNVSVRVGVSEKLDGEADLVILAVKTQDIQAALKENANGLHSGFLLTTQNGIQADHIAARYVDRERIFTSIVMFGATYLPPGAVVHNFEGSWMLGRLFGKPDEDLFAIANTLNAIFPSVVTEDMQGMKYLKVFVNANNCIPAIHKTRTAGL